ncbi:MAG: FAD-dependent oxidoreductase [Chitinophagales bacterium]|nr:MAG: FAD-dependent oxidoreductase [Chitinophagales bacterium]
MDYDFLIVGQGIAGSLLAWFLHRQGKRVLIIDTPDPSSASRIALGLINPVTGKRLVKSWRIDELLPFALGTYRQIEQVLGIEVFHQRVLSRIFSNPEDYQFFRIKMETGQLPSYISRQDRFPECFHHAGLEGVEISQVFYLDYPLLLGEMRNWFVSRNMLWSDQFQYSQLQVLKDKAHYAGLWFTKVIFCEGSHAVNNPFFPGLPFRLSKGQILTVKLSGVPEDKIWYKGVHLVPLGRGVFRVGSTYEWDFQDSLPTPEGREALIRKLQNAVRLPFEVLEHQAAIRPTVVDRRPLIGMHSKYACLGIFNGLGTKGASLAPFFGHIFAEALVYDRPSDWSLSPYRNT